MTIIVRDDELDALALMPLAVEAVEAAFAARARGAMVAPPRHRVSFPGHGDLVFTVGGTVDAAPVAGFRVYDTFSDSMQDQVVAVWSAETGGLLGIVLGSRLGDIRTGAIGAVAIRHMSAPDAGTVGVVGCGRQARTQLLGAAAVRDIARVRVFSRSADNRTTFAAEMAALLKIPVEAVGDARAAVDGADIVLCATTSPIPVIAADWLKPGAHVNTVGPKSVDGHEVGRDVAERAAAIATDSPEQTQAYGSPFFLDGMACGARMVDLADIVGGTAAARQHGSDTTLFCSTGLAGTEVLVAARVLAARVSPS